METKELILQSERNRKRLIEIIYKAKAGHIGGDLSCLNVLTALYFDVMNVDAGNPKDNLRDRFILSKGHGGPGDSGDDCRLADGADGMFQECGSRL